MTVETGLRGIAALLAAYLVLVFIVGVLLHEARAGERDVLRDRVDTRVASTATTIAGYVRELQAHQRELATRRLAGDVAPAEFERLVQDQGFSGAVLLDDRGRVIANAPLEVPLRGVLFGPRYWHLSESLKGRTAISGVVRSAGPGVLVIGTSVPFRTTDGRNRVFSGAYRAGATPMMAYLRNVSSLPGHRVYLVDANDQLVDLDGPYTSADPSLAAQNPDLAAAIAGRAAGETTLGGVPSYYTTANVRGTPWRVVFTAPTAAVYSPLEGPGQWVPWVVLGAFTATGLLAIGLAGRYHRQGRRLAESEVRYRSILNGTPDAFIGIDHNSVITDWNPATEAMLGWTAAEVVGRAAGDVYLPEHVREGHDRAVRMMAAGEFELPTTATEFEVRHRDGHIIPVELVVSAVPWDSGWRLHAFLRDTTPRREAERELRLLAGIIAATTDAVLTKRLDGTITTWNPAAERLYGWRADEVIGRGIEVLVPEEKLAELQAIMRSAAAGIPVSGVETIRRRKDGSTVDVSLSVAPLHDGDGAVIGACATARDITEQHRQAAELREAEARFRLAFDAVPVGMALTSLDPADHGRLLRVNGGFCWMLGYTEEELLQRTFTDITHPDDVESELELLAPFLEGRQRTIRFEKRYVRGDGSTVWAMVSSAVVDGPDGRPRYSVTQVEDITARRAEQERLTALALADPLTGLANRLLFDDRLAQAVHRAGRHDRTIAIVYCDLDHFKPVNDQFGHAVGDELLRQVGHRLMVAMRPSDTVARLGGDEFAVICEDLPNAEAAITIADRVRTTVEGTYLVSAGAVRIGCSVGVATASGSHIESRELVARADLSMFSDKRTRRSDEPVSDLPDRRREPTPEGATPSS